MWHKRLDWVCDPLSRVWVAVRQIVPASSCPLSPLRFGGPSMRGGMFLANHTGGPVQGPERACEMASVPFVAPLSTWPMPLVSCSRLSTRSVEEKSPPDCPCSRAVRPCCAKMAAVGSLVRSVDESARRPIPANWSGTASGRSVDREEERGNDAAAVDDQKKDVERGPKGSRIFPPLPSSLGPKDK